MFVKLRRSDSFLSSFTSARSAGKPLRCAQAGTQRSWNKGNTGGRGKRREKKEQRGRFFFPYEDDWLVTKKTGSPSGFWLSPARTWRSTGSHWVGQPKIFSFHTSSLFLEGNHACPEGSCCATKHIFRSNYSEIRGTKWVPMLWCPVLCGSVVLCAACLLCLSCILTTIRKSPNRPPCIIRLVMQRVDSFHFPVVLINCMAQLHENALEVH